MKRLLLGPAILSPLALLGFCSFHTPKLPDIPAVIRGAGDVPAVVRQIPLDDFKQFPTPPVVPVVPLRKPHATKPHQVKPSAHRVARPTPTRQPRVVPNDPPDVPAPLPPQQGPICIFPFNMIPSCTPGVP